MSVSSHRQLRGREEYGVIRGETHPPERHMPSHLRTLENLEEDVFRQLRRRWVNDNYNHLPTTPRSEQSAPTNEAMADHPRCPSPPIGHHGDSISALIDIIAESEEGSSHVVSPAIADDDGVFQEYLFANTTYGQSRRMVRFHLNLNNPSQHTRPILFNTVPKSGKRESESRSLAASYCEIIEKLVEPYQNDLINL